MDPAIDQAAWSPAPRAAGERSLLELLDRLPVPILLSRPVDGEIVYVNLATVGLARAIGPQDLVGRPLNWFVEPEEVERVEEASRVVVSGGVPGTDRVYRVRRCDDTPAVVEVHSIPFDFGDETVLLAVLLDVTERFEAQRVLAFAEQRYRSLVEIAPMGIAIHVDGRYTFANKEFARMLAAPSPSEIIGMQVSDTLAPEHRESAVAEMRYATAAGVPRARLHFVMVGLDGREFPVEAVGRRIGYEDSEVTEVFVREIAGPSET